MRIPRGGKLMIESPSVATGDIAFNLLIFFLVCASAQPESGRRQEIPRSEQEKKTEKSDNLEVNLTRQDVEVNGTRVALEQFPSRIRELLAAKAKPEDKIVVVKSAQDTPYRHWIQVTGWIEEAGGTITLQVEEEQEVLVN